MAWTLTYTDDSATIGTTEYFLASDSTTATYQTTKCYLQVVLDLNALVAGDQYVLKFYEKVNAGTARVFYDATFSGAQGTPNWISPEFKVGGTNGGWEVSLDRTAGSDRTIAWSLRKTVEV